MVSMEQPMQVKILVVSLGSFLPSRLETRVVLTDEDFAWFSDPDARHVAAVEDEDLAVRDERAARCVLRVQLGVDVAQVAVT